MRSRSFLASSTSISSHAQATDCACDHLALELRPSFEDRVELRVAVPPLDRVLAHVAVAAEDLDGLRGDAHCGLAGLELAHRALAVLERLAGGAHPRRPPHEQS